MTLGVLDRIGILHAGAGKDDASASAIAARDLGAKGRVFVLSAARLSSGVPETWSAGPNRAGINLLPDLSADTVDHIGETVRKVKRPGDVVVLSLHWGINWGSDVPEEQVRFGHGVIDRAGVDILFGHSSHHPRPIEVYHGKLILYGCGDLLNDYEGISGHENYRPNLSLLYFVTTDAASGKLLKVEMLPMQVRRFRLGRAGADDARLLADLLGREGRDFGTVAGLTPEEKSCSSGRNDPAATRRRRCAHTRQRPRSADS